MPQSYWCASQYARADVRQRANYTAIIRYGQVKFGPQLGLERFSMPTVSCLDHFLQCSAGFGKSSHDIDSQSKLIQWNVDDERVICLCIEWQKCVLRVPLFFAKPSLE